MKIIAWNCNMAFRKKVQYLSDYPADLLVISECENEQNLKLEQHIPNCTTSIWIGDNPHKGLGVFSFGADILEIHEAYNPAFRYIIPIKWIAETEYLVFAIWAMPHPQRAKSYVGQIWGALQYYTTIIDDCSLFIGDFNSNQIWDKERRQGNHSDVVDFLDKKGLISLYHTQTGEEHGKETQATLFLLKKINRPYHMDYCFFPENMRSPKTKLEVGQYEDWIKWSDHMPLFIEI